MDEKNSNLNSTECPSVEDLSFFLDEPSDNLIAEHVASCQTCQAVLAAYDQIDRIQRDCATAPADLDVRIKNLCRQQKMPKRPLIRFPGVFSWVRLAAGLTVLASAAAVLTYVAGHGLSSSAPALASRKQIPSDGQKLLNKVEQTLPGEVFSLTDQMRLQGNIDANTLQNVSTGPKFSTNSAARRKYRIGSQVEHIWLVDDLQNGKQVLDQLATSSGSSTTWQQDDSANSLKATLSGTDSNIQNLVNILKDRNWVLLSPAWPQPHAENMALLTGNLTQYQAILVKKE